MGSMGHSSYFMMTSHMFCQFYLSGQIVSLHWLGTELQLLVKYYVIGLCITYACFQQQKYPRERSSITSARLGVLSQKDDALEISHKLRKFFLKHALVSLNTALTQQNIFLMIVQKHILII